MKSARGKRGRKEAQVGNGREAKARGAQWGGVGCGSAIVKISERDGQCGHHRLASLLIKVSLTV